MSDDEPLIMRITKIGGISRANDYQVIWGGISIGRIMKANGGASSDKPQWSWNCYIHGRPSSADDSGTGRDIEDAKAKVRKAWARIRAGLTEADIGGRAQQYAEPAARRSPDMIGSDVAIDEKPHPGAEHCGGGLETVVSNRIFQLPPSRTSTAVQNPAASIGAPVWFFPVIRYSPMDIAVSAPNGQA
jgi:hypothetical protein